jgi:hypothetical protein
MIKSWIKDNQVVWVVKAVRRREIRKKSDSQNLNQASLIIVKENDIISYSHHLKCLTVPLS